MSSWTAGFAVATEVSRRAINLVLARFLKAMAAQLQYHGKLGKIGSVDVEVKSLEVLDMEDPAPLGGVVTDVQAEADFQFRLFGIRLANTNLLFRIDDVEIDLSRTDAGLPKGVVLRVTPTLKASLTFPRARFIMKWLLNKVIGPLISLGVWLAFRILRKVEVPVWDLVDVFGALGLRFAPNSPLLTAQKATQPESLLLASDFNLVNPTNGQGAQLQQFIPAHTNVGATVHEKVVTAAVQIAFTKGWAPTRFHFGKWKIYLNAIGVAFEQDKIQAFGSLKAKRGKCWCRVKVRIQFRASMEPRIVDAATPAPKLELTYDADINVHVSTSGMLVVLGVIMFAPVFLSLTITMSYLINILLNQFLPFSITWQKQGVNLVIRAKSVHFSGFAPLHMHFPLQLDGKGSYDLSRFTQFQLPGGAQVDVGFTGDSVAVQPDEFRVAVELK